MTSNPIKVLIVEDSAVSRELLTYIINADPMLKVIGFAENGIKALEFIQKERPDVITMDIVMPKMDGYEATRQIMQNNPIPIIIISATVKKEDVNASFKAMEAGALAVFEKPTGPQDPNFHTLAKALRESIKIMSGVKLIARRLKSLLKPTAPPIEEVPQPISTIEAVAIGASLGGPQALSVVLSEIPAFFPVPIFIVQHISSGFTEGFAEWLSHYTPLTVKIAKDREHPQAGTVYIAPDHFHMEVSKNCLIQLVDAPLDGGLKPSVNRLFRSMAHHYGSKAVGVLLTGMGKDGAEGLKLMKEKGSLTIAQDEESCLMFGMPKEAIQLGATNQILPLSSIAQTLKHLIMKNQK
jgi:two-component system, chemotaxis family, protein-glutamate methylesterase/glutaminase